MSDTLYKPRPFDGGVFTNDQRTGEHVSNIDLERDAGGFRLYRIGLHSEYTPIVNVGHAASFDRVQTAMGEWSDLDADGWATLRTAVLAHVAEVLEYRTGLEVVG